MAEITKKEFDQLKKEVEQLRKEKAEREATAVDNLDEHIAGKEKLLAIELKIAQAIGDTGKALSKATEINKIWEKTNAGAFVRGSEAAKKFADSIGMSEKEIERLINLHEELGPVGLEAMDMMKKGSEDVAVKIGLVSKKADKILGGMVKIGKMASSPEGIKGMGIALKDTFKPSRMAASLLLKIAEQTILAAIAADKATASFAKQTGMGRTMTKQILDTGLAHRNLGIGVEESGKAYTALATSVDNFSSMSEGVQDRMAVTAAAFDRFGLGGETAGIMIEDFTKRLGMTGDQAVDLTNDLALSAKALGLSMSKFVKGFQAANKTLAVYGKKGVKVYKNVASAAKAAGVETETLLGLAGKFDTFSDAANTTGKLNAILGTQMSAMDMLAMKEDERIEYLIRNMQASGKQFKDMNKFTQLAVANAAGITDMAEANKVFGMSMGKYKEHQRKMAAQSKSQEEMNKRMKEAQGIAEQLKLIMANFAISLSPYIETIKDVVQALADFMQKGFAADNAMKGFIASLVILSPVLLPVLNLFKIFGLNLSFIGKGMGKVIGLIASKIPLLNTLTASQGAQNTVQQTSRRISIVQAKAMLLLGKAVMFVGIGIGIAAAGIALFVSQFGKLSIDKMFITAAVIGLMGAGFFFLAKGLMAATVPAAGFAAAVLAIGFGIGIVFASMALFVSMLTGLIEQLVLLSLNGWGAVGVLYGLAGAMTSIAAAAAVMANPLSMVGLYILWELMEEMTLQAQAQATMATAVGGAISGMGDLATNMKEAVTKFADLASADFFAVFAGMYLGIRSFMNALDLDSEHGIKVSHTLENLALIATGTSAGAMSGNTGNAIVAAINKMGAKQQKQTIRLEIDSEGIKKLLEDGYYELECT